MCFQTAETVESIVVQLMEKQRCARAAALSGKALDCPGCNDPNQECSLHHVPGEKNFSFIQILIHPKLFEADKLAKMCPRHDFTNSESQSKRVLFAYSLFLVWILDLVILRDWLKKF